jgi:hypothetical protein
MSKPTMQPKLFRVNYEEYLHFEEYIEASDAEEAKRVFEKNIELFEPLEGEQYCFDAEEAIDNATSKVGKE